jgi:very-short-patch-repair endonuclease
MEDGTNARHMRNNPTDAEARLWEALSARKVGGVRFNRQVRITPFICDFVARTPQLIIEVDGGQHAENEADARRTRFLESMGYRVIRFWNNDVLGNLDGVVTEIERVLAALPSPDPSRSAEGERKRQRPGSIAPLPLAGGVGGGPDRARPE